MEARACLSVSIRERATDQCQDCKRKHISIENPLNSNEIRRKIGTKFF